MVGHVAARALARVVLLKPAPLLARARAWSRPPRAFVHGVLAEDQFKKVCDRALVDHKRAVHVGFAKLKLGVEEDRALNAGDVKRTATGVPVRSPTAKAVPRDVVTFR